MQRSRRVSPDSGKGSFLWSVPIGFQLSAIYALMLVVVLSLLGVALYSSIDNFLIKNTVDRLNAVNGISSGRPLPFDRFSYDTQGGGFPRPDRGGFPTAEQIASTLVHGLSATDVAIAVRDSTGEVISSTTKSLLTDSTPYIPPLPDDWQDKISQVGSVQWVAKAPSGGRKLVMLTPVVLVSGRQQFDTTLYVEQVASLDAADGMLNYLKLLLGLGIVLGTILGVAAGLALTRVVLKPLDRMARTAAAIEAGDLNRRLRLPPGRNEVARLGHAFDGMVDRLASALEAQRRFVADASHELRTPLTSLEGLSEMLLMGADRGDMGTVHRTLRSMHNELGRLTRLVTDLLTLSRLDSTDTPAPINFTTLDACALLKEVAEQVSPMAESRGVRVLLGCEGPSLVRGEADRLKQVLINLVDNALRYTPAEGSITLAMLGDTARHQVHISVQDTGPGIPPADLPHVFDRFYRGDVSRARATGNSGLGLAIAKSIVQMHSGTISVTSPPGKGACFTLTLPSAPPQSVQTRPVAPVQQPEEVRHV